MEDDTKFLKLNILEKQFITRVDKGANLVRASKIDLTFHLTRKPYNKMFITISAMLRCYNTVTRPEHLYEPERLVFNTDRQLDGIDQKERKIFRTITGPTSGDGIWKI